MQTKYIPFLMALVVPTLPVCGEFSFGLDANYLTLFQRAGLSSSPVAIGIGDISGFVVSPYFHWRKNLGEVITLGLGPYGGFGRLTPDTLSGAASEDTTTLMRLGGEAVLTFNASETFRPFIRGMFGKDFIEETVVYRASGAAPSITISYGTIHWMGMAGLKFYLNDVLNIYMQAGLAGSPKTIVSATNVTNDQTAKNIAAQYNAVGVWVEYTSFMFGGGFSLEF